MKLRTRIPVGLATAVLIGAPALASEHEGPQTPATTLEELLVIAPDSGYRSDKAQSATRLNIPIDEIPVNIQIVTEDLMSDFELVTNRDALQFTSSVTDKAVRGFSTGEFFRNGFISLSDTPGYVVQRMEILRGPTAVLNGPTTSGGAINILTKKAALDEDFGEFGGYWGASEDSRDNYGVNMDVNAGSIMPEASYGAVGAFRFVGGYQGDTGFNTEVLNEQYALLPTLTLRPWENTFIGLEYYKYEVSTDRTDRPMGAELSIPGPVVNGITTEQSLAEAYGIDPRSTWFAPDTDITESLDDISLSWQQAFGEQFFFNIRYNHHDRDFRFGPGQRPRIDIFFGPVQVSGPPGSTDPADFNVRRRTEFLDLTNEIDQFAADFTFLPGWGDDPDDHSFILGAATYEQNSSLTIRRPFVDTDGDDIIDGWLEEFFDPAQIDQDRADGSLNFNSAGVDYALRTALDRAEEITLDNVYLNYQGRFIDDRLSLVAGVTYSEIELKRRQPPSAPAGTTKNDDWLPQLGAVFSVVDAIALYFNYSESQQPDLNDPDFNVTRIRNSDMIEAGVRLNFIDDRLGINWGYYSIEQKISGTNFQTADSEGWDFDVFYYPTDSIEVVFGWANNETDVTASSNPGQVGDPLADEVPNKLALWTKYTLGGGDTGLSFGGGFTWIDKRPRWNAAPGSSGGVKKDDNGNVLEWDDVTRLDLFAQYVGNFGVEDRYQYDVSLNLRNLTKDDNISNTVPLVPLQGGLNGGGGATTFDGSIEVMLGLRLRYR